MTISGILRQFSTETEWCLETAPPLNERLFEQFTSQVKPGTPMYGIGFQLHQRRHLRVKPPQPAPRNLRQIIEEGLNTAENAVAAAEKAQLQAQQAQKQAEQNAINAAGTLLGVPVK